MVNQSLLDDIISAYSIHGKIHKMFHTSIKIFCGIGD